jgi:hypothetical protein
MSEASKDFCRKVYEMLGVALALHSGCHRAEVL